MSKTVCNQQYIKGMSYNEMKFHAEYKKSYYQILLTHKVMINPYKLELKKIRKSFRVRKCKNEINFIINYYKKGRLIKYH